MVLTTSDWEDKLLSKVQILFEFIFVFEKKCDILFFNSVSAFASLLLWLTQKPPEGRRT